MSIETTQVPADAAVVQLYRIARGELIACEPILFFGGAAAIDTLLRRARISGRVDFEGKIDGHFADLQNANGDMVATVALDAASYGALKNRWMRTRVKRYAR